MSRPRFFVMSTHATGRRDARRPAGVLHGVPHAMPPLNQTLCGLVELYWFGDVDFETIDGTKCPTCVDRIAGPRAGP